MQSYGSPDSLASSAGQWATMALVAPRSFIWAPSIFPRLLLLSRTTTTRCCRTFSEFLSHARMSSRSVHALRHCFVASSVSASMRSMLPFATACRCWASAPWSSCSGQQGLSTGLLSTGLLPSPSSCFEWSTVEVSTSFATQPLLTKNSGVRAHHFARCSTAWAPGYHNRRACDSSALFSFKWLTILFLRSSCSTSSSWSVSTSPGSLMDSSMNSRASSTLQRNVDAFLLRDILTLPVSLSPP
mmetsp:Transcript_45936/g.127967  ORF Transcript_45936/g.127967 Transcript_45936/m.127967 type:complete len:243 (-) Transcript_45936:409-1137(-)